MSTLTDEQMQKIRDRIAATKEIPRGRVQACDPGGGSGGAAMNRYGLVCVALCAKVALFAACLWFAAHDYTGCAWLALLMALCTGFRVEEEEQ